MLSLPPNLAKINFLIFPHNSAQKKQNDKCKSLLAYTNRAKGVPSRPVEFGRKNVVEHATSVTNFKATRFDRSNLNT